MNQSSSFSKILVFVAALLIILACLPGPVPAATVASPVETAPPAASEAPAQPVAADYFTEEFDAESGQWSHFIIDASARLTSPGTLPSLAPGEVDGVTVQIADGNLLFDIESKGLWAYATYDGFEYEDVHMAVVAENRGTNDNYVSLICRYSKAEGWYEFNIANNGLYDIYYAHFTKDNKVLYGKLADGGSNKIKQGKETNTYEIACKGRTLVLTINGYETRRLDDNQYVLQKGKVGVSVSSFKVLPAKVQIDSVTISKP